MVLQVYNLIKNFECYIYALFNARVKTGYAACYCSYYRIDFVEKGDAIVQNLIGLSKDNSAEILSRATRPRENSDTQSLIDHARGQSERYRYVNACNGKRRRILKNYQGML